ncbi:MAG: hypothetical protein ABSD98_03870 [Candidatus Korobacteraceae bacterium]|jgi:hypothetical protein
MKKALAAAYGAVIALLVSVAYDQLLTKWLHWPPSAALTGAVLLGVLLLVLYEIVGGSKALARRLSPFRKVGGAWKINLTNDQERPISVCKIHFTQRQYAYNGYGINADGTLGSEWSSRDTHYDEEKEEMSFTSDATILKNGKRVRNYGYIKFYQNANGRVEYGNGYFVDMADVLTQTHMTLVRIKDGEFDDLVKASFEKTTAQHEAAQPLAPQDPLGPSASSGR